MHGHDCVDVSNPKFDQTSTSTSSNADSGNQKSRHTRTPVCRTHYIWKTSPGWRVGSALKLWYNWALCIIAHNRLRSHVQTKVAAKGRSKTQNTRRVETCSPRVASVHWIVVVPSVFYGAVCQRTPPPQTTATTTTLTHATTITNSTATTNHHHPQSLPTATWMS